MSFRESEIDFIFREVEKSIGKIQVHRQILIANMKMEELTDDFDSFGSTGTWAT
jgi:hypothetical protein